MKRTYVTHTTKNYHDVALGLYKSIKEFSKYPLYLVCINYDPREIGMEVPEGVIIKCIESEIVEADDDSFGIHTNGNFYVNRRKKRTLQVLGKKPDACLSAIEDGYDEIIYIDTDSIATPLTDELFEYCSEITTYPLASEGPYQFVMVPDENGNMMGNPFENVWPDWDVKLTLEWPLLSFLKMGKGDRGVYRTTNLFICNKKCKYFLETWKIFMNLIERVGDPYYHAPFSDETIYNVLYWKEGKEGLPVSYINIQGIDTVKHFYDTEVGTGTLIDDFYFIPKEKKSVKVFHGEKRKDQINLIIDHLKSLSF